MIRVACRNPGEALYLIDHHNFFRQTQTHVELVIRRLLDAAPLPVQASFNFFRGERFTVNSPFPFDWEPNIDALGFGPVGPPDLVGLVSSRELEIQRIQAEEDRRLLGFTTRPTRGFDQTVAAPPPKPALQRISEEDVI